MRGNANISKEFIKFFYIQSELNFGVNRISLLSTALPDGWMMDVCDG